MLFHSYNVFNAVPTRLSWTPARAFMVVATDLCIDGCYIVCRRAFYDFEI
jgi:hypothetical protein